MTTDREKVDFLAEKLGTLIRRTHRYSYISNRRYRWDELGNLIQVSKPVKGGTRQWEDV